MLAVSKGPRPVLTVVSEVLLRRLSRVNVKREKVGLLLRPEKRNSTGISHAHVGGLRLKKDLRGLGKLFGVVGENLPASRCAKMSAVECRHGSFLW